MKYFVIFLVLIGFVGTAFACLCDDLTVEQRINQADVVFSGTVTEQPWSFSDEYVISNFAIQVVWKGADSFPLVKNGHVSIITPTVSTACGVNLIQNKEYLIYAKIQGDDLKTTTCDGSWFLDGRNDDIDALKKIGGIHYFLDAREIKGSSVECGGPGLESKENCEFGKIMTQIILPLVIAIPIVAVSVFLIWRKRK